MANYGGELSSLDFSNLIGGPLTAVVEAQSQAAQSTVDFIKAMGFDDEGKPQYVTFKYPKETQPYVPAVLNEQGQQVTPAVPAKIEMMEMQVPFLTRSEEHTSELQSRQYLVCRLLLEKKTTTRHDARPHTRSQLSKANFEAP